MTRNQTLWILWIALSVIAAVILTGFIFIGGPRHILLIGKTSAGHGQIELACESCHTTSLVENLFKSPKKIAGEMTKACGTCHAEELASANDSHPTKKFRGAKKAKTRARLNAFYCQTCHAEHVPEVTRPMAVSLPEDLCVACHEKIGEERESHAGLEFVTCASAGCHNFHDNTALYESFLVKHGEAEDFLAHPVMEFASVARSPDVVRVALETDDPLAALQGFLVPAVAESDAEQPTAKETAPAETALAETDKAEIAAKAEDLLGRVLTTEDALAPEPYMEAEAITAWSGSAHALAGVNCAGCHAPEAVAQELGQDLAALSDSWIEKPGRAVCADCHENQATTFTMGKHGMRFHPELAPPRDAKQDGVLAIASQIFEDEPLTPLTVGETYRADLMKPESHDREIGSCNTCHAPHEVNLEVAAVEACVACHDDTHTQNYFNSQHYTLWEAELAGDGAPGTGVSCADCHMPKVAANGTSEAGGDAFYTSHNQNDYLRPNEKMIRPVCMSCHGLAFSIDALADPELIESNFNGRPSTHIQSVDWALQREE